jgi:hypothetical protein
MRLLQAAPLCLGSCEKIGTVAGAGISPRFYKCGRLEGRGNKALQLTTIIEVSHREGLTRKGTAVKLFRYSYPPLNFKDFFHPGSWAKKLAGGKGSVAVDSVILLG